MFVVVPDFLDYLRAAFNPQSPIPYDRRFDEVKKVPLLIFDDLGTESATPWAKEKLFQLLNFRYSAHLPTVITTSAEPNEIEPWLRTRMFDVDRCQVWALKVSSYRGGADQQAKQQQRRRG
jgi:DNA replication protein DnaC